MRKRSSLGPVLGERRHLRGANSSTEVAQQWSHSVPKRRDMVAQAVRMAYEMIQRSDVEIRDGNTEMPEYAKSEELSTNDS